MAKPTLQNQLSVAAFENDLKQVRALVARGAKLDSKPGVNGVLHNACMYKAIDEDTAIELIALGAKVTLPGYNTSTPLHLAAAEGKLRVVTALVDHGAQLDPVNGLRRTPLMSAVACGRVAVVRLLLARGASLEGRDHEQKSVLELAATATLRALLEKAATPKVTKSRSKSSSTRTARRTR